MIEQDGEEGDWSNRALFRAEIKLLQSLDHENVIGYYDFYEDTSFLYVVMEKCNGGEVFNKLLQYRRFSEGNAIKIIRQIVNSIAYIHDLNIVHRDIKAENFLFKEDSLDSAIKMIDFGFATTIEPGQMLEELCGSPHYLAPELIGQKYSKPVDLWALGVLVYLLLYGKYPYDGANPQEIMKKILTQKVPWTHTKAQLSPSCIDFLTRLLQRNANKRITADACSNHNWLKNIKEAEGKEIKVEVIRDAQRKATATRKKVDPNVEEKRNHTLQSIAEDHSKGIKIGRKVLPQGQADLSFLASKPEFQRRGNKMTTAPSAELKGFRTNDQSSGPSKQRKSVLGLFGQGAGAAKRAIGGSMKPGSLNGFAADLKKEMTGAIPTTPVIKEEEENARDKAPSPQPDRRDGPVFTMFKKLIFQIRRKFIQIFNRFNFQTIINYKF